MNDEKKLTKEEIYELFDDVIVLSELARSVEKKSSEKNFNVCLGTMALREIHLLRGTFEKVVDVLQPTVTYAPVGDVVYAKFMYNSGEFEYMVFALYERNKEK